MEVKVSVYTLFGNNNSDFLHRALLTTQDEIVVRRGSIGSDKENEKKDTIICHLWMKNRCVREDCSYSHDPDSLIPTPVPMNFKTIPCNKSRLTEGCRFTYNCLHLHENERTRTEGDLVYVQMKRKGDWVNCPRGTQNPRLL